ncbi:MAG: 3-phosphoserine/phosphohydroxythreonine transaminase [Bacteroidetes bacterium]|nr:3-phosphoserine/phosphohydroxythreonine transaminase [Bacteroidota bacterium]
MNSIDPNRLHNFSAGPGTLPLAVLESVCEELPVFAQTGSSVMEISHRSPEYIQIEASARERITSLLGLSQDWHILFLGGGASMQFHQVPLNFLPHDGQAGYLLTGSWAKKAHAEADQIGKGRMIASSADSGFNYIPDPSLWDLSSDDVYVHYTSNNTIYGTQFQSTPDVDSPLVCDASSDFLSRPIELDRYGLIYAGAQKNIGPAGVTVILIRDDFLDTRKNSLPTMLDYGTHAAKCFNTPPVFAVYIVEKVLDWLQDQGGISGIQKINHQKASLLYSTIDQSEFYKGTAEKTSRSEMNVTFRLHQEDLEPVFIHEAAKHGLLALKGHRSVGGMRASIYNACTLDSVKVLVDFMKDFEKRNG